MKRYKPAPVSSYGIVETTGMVKCDDGEFIKRDDAISAITSALQQEIKQWIAEDLSKHFGVDFNQYID